MKYLLDTNVFVSASLALNPHIHARMSACDEGDLVTSAIVYAEVLYGSERGKPPPIHVLAVMIEEVAVLDFGTKAAASYAKLNFKRASYDRLIAAHAISEGLILVTDNTSDFTDIPGLPIENWTLPL